MLSNKEPEETLVWLAAEVGEMRYLVLLITLFFGPLSATVYVPATITRVVDGDTVIAVVRRHGLELEEKIRLIGLDTPGSDSFNPMGKEAVSYVKGKLQDRDVFLELDVQERDKYERLLAYVWLRKPHRVTTQAMQQHLLNAQLVVDGYAQVMNRPPNGKYNDFFKVFQRQAQDAKLGLWERG